jgi:hypothetical protein
LREYVTVTLGLDATKAIAVLDERRWTPSRHAKLCSFSRTRLGGCPSLVEVDRNDVTLFDRSLTRGFARPILVATPLPRELFLKPARYTHLAPPLPRASLRRASTMTETQLPAVLLPS